MLHDVVSLWDHSCTGLPDISPSAWTRVHLHASVTCRENMVMPSVAVSHFCTSPGVTLRITGSMSLFKFGSKAKYAKRSCAGEGLDEESSL